GEAKHFKNISQSVNDFKVDSNKNLIFTARKDLKVRDEEKLKEEKDYEVMEEIPFWINGEGVSNKYRTHLYQMDLEQGEVTELVSDYYNVESFAVQGDKICCSMSYFTDKAKIKSNLYLYNQTEQDLNQLTDRDWTLSFVQFKSDSEIYFGANEMEDMGLNSNPDIFSLQLADNQVKRLTNKINKSLWSSVGNDCRLGGGNITAVDSQKLYFITTEGYNSYLNQLTETQTGKQIKKIIDKEGSIDMISVSKGQVAFIGFRGNKLQELYLLQEEEEKQISTFNEDLLNDKVISSPEHFTVTASDGTELDAWVMRPIDFKEGEQYPTVLEIHGGPKTVYGSIFFHEFQVLASSGYAVVFSNPRGSDGKGNEFADIRSGYGDRDYQDLMEVMDTALVKFDFIDKDALGVGGGSYGGYMTNWIIGHTDRFKAGVSQRSISNWISMFGTTDIGYFFVPDQYKGETPWTDPDKLWDGSPLKYADRVNTPTLFIHSEQDYRCWLTEGLQMFTALKFHGVESRLCMFKGENHELSRSGKPKHRIRRLQEMVDWFDKYLK
ncbi:MAG: prolyl oligopeptidase family serine peptidase, partial [Bacillota bacterium]